ncbi:MAG: hypothetical protein M1514_01875 [Patescibacteria group bacterium]|nr:hypothetical protein [Patescibacteria group bacterium]
MLKNIFSHKLSLFCLSLLLVLSLTAAVSGQFKANKLSTYAATPVDPTPTPTPTRPAFIFLATKNPVSVNEKFFLNWVWDAWTTRGFCNKSVTLTINIPAGIVMNWNPQCQSGNGCQVTQTYFNTWNNNCTPEVSPTTDAYALKPGNYVLSTSFVESTGLKETKTVYLQVNSTPTPTPTPNSMNLTLPEKIEVTVLPYQLQKIFTMTAVNTGVEYQIIGYTHDNSLTSIQMSPSHGYLGAGYSTEVSLRVGADTLPGTYEAIVNVRNLQTMTEKKIPTTIKVVTPTSTPTLTPTPTMAPTATPTPTSIPTPTPTVVLSPNHQPNIIVSSRTLTVAKRYSNYYANITGYDVDTQDKLTMKITNLPQGLYQGSCTTYTKSGNAFIQCNINGKATAKAGKYQPIVTLEDSRGGLTNERFILEIK